MCLTQVGRRDDAIASYRRALAIEPANPELHFNLANGLRDQGLALEAMDHYRQALADKPGYRKARINQGNLLRREGNVDEAIAEYRAVLESDPANPRGHHGLALSLIDKGELQAALPHAQQAAAADPDRPEVQSTLGMALQENGQLSEAHVCFKRAVALRPTYVEALGNLAGNLARQGKTAAGEEALCHALELPSPTPEASFALARIAALDFRQVDQAIGLVRECLSARPEWPEAHYDLGSLLLYQGKLAEGYAEYEWRDRLRGASSLAFTEPTWDGSDLAGKIILLYTEQGFGDAIQMARFVPLVMPRAASVVIGCSAPLVSLFAAIPGVVAANDNVGLLPRFDVQASLLSLPHLLGITPETLPADVPYLKGSAAGPAVPPADPGKRLKVGIAWAGNAKHRYNHQRSCNLSFFRELIGRHPSIAFYSLQVGESEVVLPLDIINLGPQLIDWCATAGVVGQLDVIITVDTGLAHLAGALAKPVWTLLAFMPDPRWLLDRDDSPWYPTMRLFRQESFADWSAVFRRVDEALAHFTGDLVPLVTTS